MRSRFAPKLDSLGFKRPSWCEPPSAELVRDFEASFGLSLPPDYREFLSHDGGVAGTAEVKFLEPTPCGTGTCVDMLYGFPAGDRHDNVINATRLIYGAPAVVAIGDNLIGSLFLLKCTGRDAGHVYMNDHEGRFAWPDEVFYQQFPNLSPVIQDYLVARRSGTLPAKPDGYEHVYRVASSFTEFIERLEPPEE